MYKNYLDNQVNLFMIKIKENSILNQLQRNKSTHDLNHV